MKVKIIELRFGKYGNLKPIRLSISEIEKKSKYCKIDSLQDYTELYCQRWNDNCLTGEIRKKKDY
jgi:hypothetical protein